MILINPLSDIENRNDKLMVFLAGPIKGGENWQERAISDLSDFDIYVANPRRDNDFGFNYEQQIEWETEHLSRADVIMFWFPGNGKDVEGRSYGQTSRFELGEWLAKTSYNHETTKVIVGMDDGFSGKRYVKERSRGTPTIIHDTYEETIKHFKSLISRNGRTFFTSDTHFGSPRAFNFSKRPFNNEKEMDAKLIYNWNKIISPYDTVYHLGDFGNVEVAKKLNGNIHLILGNHEEEKIKEDKTYLDKLKKAFKSVQNDLVIDLMDGTKLHLSHKPSAKDSEIFNAFGHIHGRQVCKRFGIDVGVDAHNFSPISEERFLFYKNATSSKYDEEVFL